ncbi:MAG: Glutamate-1-semialdehyde 2,1-aminomutase 2 [Alphaproteobacteria bacterium MarineAlpha10_Bin3]|nr:MAG: Glutamate-1-semialdehyde 2,1-aminomutase 2 [Alphaproteobacteria bacterium MarineAlpha10_Bin3]PPR69273.1 MAG: Glutamate-1-semialdehyde 2,1-aminomutase 2 [Alphaproteobacteria bacterium MarineAlpha4_Bin1]
MGELQIGKSAALFARATKVLPGGNSRTTVWSSPHPVYAASGEGCWLTDVDGNRYLDLLNNYTSLLHGHAHPAIMEAVTQRLPLGTAFPLPTETEIELAELLCSRVQSFDHVRFANSGSEAVMIALKAARARTGRPKIAKCEGAYHGSYDFAEVSLDSSPETWGNAEPRSVPYSHGTPQGVLDNVVVIPFNRSGEAERILRANAGDLACVLVDPMPNRGGLIPAQRGYLEMLRRVTSECGMLLIFDEVISFRLDHAGAQGVFGVDPDLTTLAKIIGGGFPIGAIAGTADAMAVFDPRHGKPLAPHGGTFNANPVSMVAGKMAMELMIPAEFTRLNALGQRIRDGIADAFEKTGIDGQVTGAGSLFRILMTSARLVDYRTAQAANAQAPALERVVAFLRDNGILIAGTGLGALSTPMGDAEVDLFVDIFTNALEREAALQ